MHFIRTLALLAAFTLGLTTYAQHDGSKPSSKELKIVQFSRSYKSILVYDANGETIAIPMSKSINEQTHDLLSVLQKLYDEGWTLLTVSTEVNPPSSTGPTVYLLERERRP